MVVPAPLLGQIGQWLKDHWILAAGVAGGVILASWITGAGNYWPVISCRIHFYPALNPGVKHIDPPW